MCIVSKTSLVFAAICVTLVVSQGSPNIISRAQWGARAPKSPAASLALKPAPYVIIHHSTGSGCETRAACVSKVKGFQNHHMDSKNWADIGYNFLVGEDGNVYEGRGWDKKGAHSVPYNSKSIGICLIGDYSNRTPNQAAIQAVKNLIAYGVSNNKIKSNYVLYGHRQTWQTACPGNKLFELIKSWSHWSAQSR